MLKRFTKTQSIIAIVGMLFIAFLYQYVAPVNNEVPSVFACTTEQECKDLVQASEQRRAELAAEQRAMEAQSATLESQVQNLMKQLESYQTEIVVTNIELSKLKMQQEQLTASIEKNKEIIKERLISSQLSLETNNDLNFIADSTSIVDFIERMQIVNDLSASDNELIQTFVEQIDQSKKNEEKQTERLKEIGKLTAEVESLKATKKAELDTYLAEIQKKVTEQQNQASQSALSEQKLKELEQAKELAQRVAIASTPSPVPQTTQPTQVSPEQPTTPAQPTAPTNPTQPTTPVQPTAPTNPTPVQPVPSAPASSSIITNAKKYLGVPYVWGGSTPNGFDCSGFTSYVYRETTGKNIGRVTTNQENAGTIIPLSQAQPGDLLFWGPRGGTYHVAIYLGGNQYIHAPYSGRTIEISDMKYFRPDFALRVS